MNPETVNLIERPYPEIVDDVLTAVVGGVVNEPIFFDVKEDVYPLAEPALEIRGITGTRDQKHQVFQKEIDYLFSEGDNAVVWQSGGLRPDDETVFHVDYFRQDHRSPLSDINVGSVTRTLSEAISREIAMVYAQINQAYRAGFIDTASGQSLDLVVSILDVKRKTKDYAIGLVTFFRDPSAGDGSIAIPEGTVVGTAKGEASFVTTQSRTLQRGQVRIDVPVRASETSKGEAGIRKAGEINTQEVPITGIARVTNFDATILGKEDESDAELRARARAVLRGRGKATLAALAHVIFEGRAKLVEVWDPNSPLGKATDPGKVTLLVEAEPERFDSLRASVEETRAAGVQATLVARYVYFRPRIVVRIAPGLEAQGKLKVIDQIVAALKAYVDGLSAGDPAEGKELLKAIKGVKDVSDPRIADVMAWRSDIGQPGAETLVEALLTATAATPPGDMEALRKVFAQVVGEAPPSAASARRIADRSLVQGLGGAQATVTEIEAGAFRVAATVNNEKWWISLDIQPSDIVLREKS